MDKPVRLISLIDEIYVDAVREYGAMHRYITLNQYEDHIGFKITALSRCTELLNGIGACYAATNNPR